MLGWRSRAFRRPCDGLQMVYLRRGQDEVEAVFGPFRCGDGAMTGELKDLERTDSESLEVISISHARAASLTACRVPWCSVRINMLTLSIYLTKLHIHMHSHPMNLHTNMIL